MPQLIAARFSFIGLVFIIFFPIMLWIHNCSATNAPDIEAVRVPPSAWITSQSIKICISFNKLRSVTALNDLPIKRCISCVLPDCLPLTASRDILSDVDLGSIPYSAVTQPCWEFLSHLGTFWSKDALHNTWVSPNFIIQEPSGYEEKFGIISNLRRSLVFLVFLILINSLYYVLTKII